MSRVKLVVFDIGGTIIEDRGEVSQAFGAALAKNSIPATAAELKEFKGASKRHVIEHFVERRWGKSTENQQRIAQAYADFRAELEGLFGKGGGRPIPGAADTFSWLKCHGIACATTTGFYRSLADTILRSAGWPDVFDGNICSDDVKCGRPAPYMIFHAMETAGVTDVREVLNVGDTPLDVQAGKRAGVLGVIGVLTGVHAEDRLRREAPSHVIQSVATLPELVEAHYL
jgi:phosphonatase-like hydrolase